MKRFLKWLILGLGILAAAGLTFRLWLPLPAKLLLVPDHLQKADCIVVLRGDDYVRFKKAVALYNQGYAKRIVVSLTPTHIEFPLDYEDFVRKVYGKQGVTEEGFMLKAFEYFGKSPEGIEFTRSVVTSTYEEAFATYRYMQRQGYRSCILVTSTYHMRRAFLIFKRITQGSAIEVFPVTAANAFYNPSQWWRKEREVRRVGEEYLSLMFNFVFDFILRQRPEGFKWA